MKYLLSLLLCLPVASAISGAFDREPSSIRGDLEAYLSSNNMPYEVSEQTCWDEDERAICSFNVDNKTEVVAQGKAGSNSTSSITVAMREEQSGDWAMWGGMAISMIMIYSPNLSSDKANEIYGELFRSATDQPSDGITIDDINYSIVIYTSKDMDFFVQPLQPAN